MSERAPLFETPGALIGMVHLAPLPGTPDARLSPAEIYARAEADARLLAEAGFDGLIVENMGDRPYLLREVGPEIVTSMTAATLAVRRAAPDLVLGVQVLAGANHAALAVAHAAGADFIRAEGFHLAAVADEGLLAEASAGPLLRYRKAIGADRIAVLADVRKKHSAHALTADLDLAEHCRTASFCGADGVIVTGSATGATTDPADLREAAEAADLPVFVGSGVSAANVADYMPRAAGFIVGSSLKVGGEWSGALSAASCGELVEARGCARKG